MFQSNIFTPTARRFTHAVACLIALVAVSIQPVLAAENLPTKNEIINLMLCYGSGTDAIGDSTRVDPLGDGQAIYGECFTDDAVFRAWFPGADFSDENQAVTVGPNGGLTGPEAWAEFVFGVFDGTYTYTQHTLSNFLVEVEGNSGTLQAYLIATHVAQEEGAVASAEVAHGTYMLQVEKVRGEWRATSLDLKLINFTPFFSAP